MGNWNVLLFSAYGKCMFGMQMRQSNIAIFGNNQNSPILLALNDFSYFSFLNYKNFHRVFWEINVLAMFFQLFSSWHWHTLAHRCHIRFNGSLESWDPMTCDVQMLSCLPGCLYPSSDRLGRLSVCQSLRLLSACVFIIYFAFWQKDFKTIILMFFPHTHSRTLWHTKDTREEIRQIEFVSLAKC